MSLCDGFLPPFFYISTVVDFCSVTENSVEVINQNMFTFFSFFLRAMTWDEGICKAVVTVRQKLPFDYSSVFADVQQSTSSWRMYHILTAVNAIIKMQFTKKEAKTRSFFFLPQFNIIKIHENINSALVK